MTKDKLIFIVDDDPFITRLIEKRLASEGYRVSSFSYGEECLAEMNRKPDLIILDYYFSKEGQTVMNGMEVFDKLKEKNPNILVVMLSGQERGEIVLELARKGIDDYVIKDNNLIDNLISSITELFGRNP